MRSSIAISPHGQFLAFAALAAMLGFGSASAADGVKPLKALLVIGGCCHDYAAQKAILAQGLAARAHVEVTIAYDPDTTTKHLNPVYEKADWAAGFDVVIHDECSSDVKDKAVIDRILAPHRAGLPAVLLHCGMHSYRSEGYPGVTPWFEFTGLQSTGHGPQAPIDVGFLKTDHAITKGLADWTTINEELYNNSAGKLLESATPLARGRQTTRSKKGESNTSDYVVAWINDYKGTKVFATTLGHNNQTVADARYLDLVTRGLLWSCGKLQPEYLKESK
ncbi:MAG TPA: ThuA domain-containing protein [Pirellulaceae bacterium]|nr:ThuA domain-containing protein [Pirellulaceae bacterium]